MTVGNIGTTDMGIDNLKAEDITNYLIYMIFIYFMCLLIQNLFTSVAFDELNKQLQDAKTQNICAKIDYVKHFEKFKFNSRETFLFGSTSGLNAASRFL